MSAVTHPEVDEDEDEEAPGLWQSFGSALRLIVGWFSVAIGVLNLLVELDRADGQPDGAYVFFHFIVLVGGVLLVSLAWIGAKPGIAGYVAGAAVLVAGVVISAIPANDTVCCMKAFSERHGYPFTIAARDAGTRWHIDSQHLLADLLFWGYLGLVVLLTVALSRKVASREEEAG
ncbi:hypothetical protein [Actinoplanes sp. N902-109]|uniref:hypothetical protein n=1 Tax=Actinoplanes sp. (strain N902-109) TaxID=649831 RepID=UPI0003295EE3|nr:hypothetical protein [Actinoplanes sp. N902-109]AGL20961.1 hypothetical protein L083_7451 [Actinoplanes sp. N902-109]